MRPSRLRWWIEAPLLFGLYQGFELVRAEIVGGRGPAQRHARAVAHAERVVHLFSEPALNHWVSTHKTVAQAMNIYYGTVHFLGPPLVLIWLWRRRPDRYGRWRNILIAVGIVALIGFWLYPLAPPRLTPGLAAHFVDTSTRFGGLGPLDRGNFVDTNPYAAMPSLHLAWSGWCAWAFIASAGPRRWRWLSLGYPLLTGLVVVGTANHWIFDGIAGLALLAVAVGLERRCPPPEKRAIMGPAGQGRPAAAEEEEVRTRS